MEKIKILSKKFATFLKDGSRELWLLETDTYGEIGYFANNKEEIRLINALPINNTYEVNISTNNNGKYISDIRDFNPNVKFLKSESVPIFKGDNTFKKDIPIGLMSLIKCSVELAKTDKENCLSACVDIAENEYKRLLKEWCK